LRYRNTHFTLLRVQQQIETTGAHPRQLAHDDVLGDAPHGIDFCVGGGVHQHVHRFLEGASHQSAGVLSVDAVTRDGHQVTFGGHDVAQQSEMPVVHVQTVELQHGVHFFLDGFTNGFDSQHRENLADVVGEGPDGIDVSFGENLHHAGAVSFEQPLGDRLELSGLRDHDPLLGVVLGQVHVHFRDGLDTLQGHVAQHVRFDAPQEHVVVHLVHVFVGAVSEFAVVAVHYANSQDQLLRVVVVEDAIQVVTEAGVDLLGYLFHGQFLVGHPLPVQFDAQQPR
jgi:hypothetical protein